MRNNLQVDLHLILSAKTLLITKDKYGQIVVKCEKNISKQVYQNHCTTADKRHKTTELDSS